MIYILDTRCQWKRIELKIAPRKVEVRPQAFRWQLFSCLQGNRIEMTIKTQDIFTNWIYFQTNDHKRKLSRRVKTHVNTPTQKLIDSNKCILNSKLACSWLDCVSKHLYNQLSITWPISENVLRTIWCPPKTIIYNFIHLSSFSFIYFSSSTARIWSGFHHILY